MQSMNLKLLYIFVLQILSHHASFGQNLAIEIHKGEIMGNPRSFPSLRLHKNVIYYYYDNNDNLITEFHIRSELSNKGIIKNYCNFDTTKSVERILFYYTYNYDSIGNLTQKNSLIQKRKGSSYQLDETSKYFYDKMNRISEKRWFFNPSDTSNFQYYRYHYDSVGNLRRIDSHTSNDSIFEQRYFYYDSKNLLTEEKLIKVQSQVTETDYYFYDTSDKLIKSTTKDLFSYVTYYKYNLAGKLIKENCYCDGKWLNTYKYIYKKCTSAYSGLEQAEVTR